jgi:maleylpyruvate isomerase
MTAAPLDRPHAPEEDPYTRTLDELGTATERLLAAVRRLDDAAARGPSRLPGWTRGHVVAHLARNADAMLNLVRSAGTGESIPMYVSEEARDADIEAGAGRPAAELAADCAAAAARLADALVDLPPAALDRRVRMRGTVEIAARDIPGRRLREVEIHHVDLDHGYTPAHWTPQFAVRTLDEIAPAFADREPPVAALVGTTTGRTWQLGGAGSALYGRRAPCCWLTGRSDVTACCSTEPTPPRRFRAHPAGLRKERPETYTGDVTAGGPAASGAFGPDGDEDVGRAHGHNAYLSGMPVALRALPGRRRQRRTGAAPAARTGRPLERWFTTHRHQDTGRRCGRS